MINIYHYFLLIFLIIFIYLFIHIKKKNLVYIESIDGNKYMVNNIDNKEISANLLSQITKRIFLLKDYLFKNINKFLDRKNDILLLNKNLNNRTKIYETEIDSKYTSYSVNKGEELVFCLRSKKTTEFHDINLLMYVALHEISHLACKEIGHTQLFKDIFEFIVIQAIEINLYKKIDFEENPTEYCGMTLTSSII